MEMSFYTSSSFLLYQKKILVHNFLEKKKIYLCRWHLPQKEGRKDMWQGIVTLVLDKELEKSRTVDMRINQNSSWVVLFLLSGSWDNIDHCLFMCRTSVSSLELYSNHWQAYVCLMATSVYNWNSNHRKMFPKNMLVTLFLTYLTLQHLNVEITLKLWWSSFQLFISYKVGQGKKILLLYGFSNG